jgi:hypothetical protein
MTLPQEVFGIWDPMKDEPSNDRTCMERWPSMRAAQAALRDRIAPGYPAIPRCRTRYINRPAQDNAQFYGSKDSSCIHLYRNQADPQPYALLEFGPRGGIRKAATTSLVDDLLAHMGSRDANELEADRAAAWDRSTR